MSAIPGSQAAAGAIRSLAQQAAAGGARAAPAATAAHANVQDRARAQAVEFEAVFLSSMFSQMFTGTDGDGPFGGGGSAGVWRSFLTDEYSKSFARAGGIGIADHVYRALLNQQEVRTS
jgi:Rod binding domain-containing protein